MRSSFGDGRAELALHVQAAVHEGGRGVRRQPGLGRIEKLDLLEGTEEHGLLLADEFRNAVADELPSALRGRVDAANDPLRVANQNAAAGGRNGCSRASCRYVVHRGRSCRTPYPDRGSDAPSETAKQTMART